MNEVLNKVALLSLSLCFAVNLYIDACLISDAITAKVTLPSGVTVSTKGASAYELLASLEKRLETTTNKEAVQSAAKLATL